MSLPLRQNRLGLLIEPEKCQTSFMLLPILTVSNIQSQLPIALDKILRI